MVSQIGANTISAANFMRSTTEPMTSEMVIAAKVIWKQIKTYSEITASLNVAAVLSGVTPARKYLPQAMNLLPSGPKAVP